MRQRSRLALLAVLIAAPAFAQEVKVTSTTLVQMWKQDTPGFDQATFMPATEFLGIDASKLGTDALSLHLFGWGTTDLKDQSMVGGKHAGDLTYGYLQYAFDRANAFVKAGRFTVNQGGGTEWVDGVYARTDLKQGFNVSAFAGVPVIFKNHSDNPQADQAYQRDLIVGARLGWGYRGRVELGVSYLQDGSKSAQDVSAAQPVDYTRKQLGVDLMAAPASFLVVNGHTLFDLASDRPGAPADRSKVAEHTYAATAKVLANVSFTGTFVERNFYSYYQGSTLPSLFNMNEKGMFRSTGLAAAWTPVTALQLSADVKRTSRELYGDATRAGLDARYAWTEQKLLAGVGYHKVNAFRVVAVNPLQPSFSLSHSEARAWAMIERGAFSASLDAIRLHYSDALANPNLYGRSLESQLVGSVGYQVRDNLKVSADLSYSDTPLTTKQTMGLVRVEYRFGFAAKGGK